jgi:hypothetical protein
MYYQKGILLYNLSTFLTTMIWIEHIYNFLEYGMNIINKEIKTSKNGTWILVFCEIYVPF